MKPITRKWLTHVEKRKLHNFEKLKNIRAEMKRKLAKQQIQQFQKTMY